MAIGKTQAQRFELINFLPIPLWLGFVIFNEKDMWPSAAVRILYGLTFVAAFYGISIYMIFRKRLQKGLIVLLLIPPTAVLMYVILLFLKPGGSDTLSGQAPDTAPPLPNRPDTGDGK